MRDGDFLPVGVLNSQTVGGKESNVSGGLTFMEGRIAIAIIMTNADILGLRRGTSVYTYPAVNLNTHKMELVRGDSGL